MSQPEDTSQEITQLLRQWSEGNREGLDQLLPLVYDDLHRQAARYLRRERADHTIQPTALIHEAYLKLIDQRDVQWQSRTHFFAIAAQLMRRILVDYARTKHREKRGGAELKLPLEEAALVVVDEKGVDLLALDEALTRLAAMDEQWAHSWSPDGDKIAFAGFRSGFWNIWWVSRSTKQQKQLTNYTKPNSYVRYPSWSPLGNRMVYEYAGTTGNIWVMNLK